MAIKLKYIVAALFGIMLSCFGFVLALTSGVKFGYTVGGILLVAHIVSIALAVKSLSLGNNAKIVLILISPLFVVWLIGIIALLLYLAISSLFGQI